jgi:hypothetical protein
VEQIGKRFSINHDLHGEYYPRELFQISSNESGASVCQQVPVNNDERTQKPGVWTAIQRNKNLGKTCHYQGRAVTPVVDESVGYQRRPGRCWGPEDNEQNQRQVVKRFSTC